MKAEAPIIVLGAGPAGLAAGLALGEQGLVLDSCPEPGGLCRTLHLDGAVFDWGGHSFHTPHPEIRELVFGSVEMYTQPRQAWCFARGQWIPYPFQAHYRRLDEGEIVAECAAGLAAAPGPAGASDFEDYLLRRFGPGVARHFLLPYNRKLWGPDPRRLAADWADERVAAPEGSRQPFDEHGGRRLPLHDDTQVSYPARGGFGEVMAALAGRLPHLRLGQKVVHIDPLRRELATAAGDRLRWRRLVSTLPLPDLLRLLDDVPLRLRRLADRLQALPLALVLVVIDHPVDTPVQRVYCAGPEIPAHKLVLNHNSSPALRALPRHGIQAEVALHGGGQGADDLADQVVRGLQTLGLIRSPATVRTVRIVRVPRAYPVPTHDRTPIVGQLLAWLEERGIDSVGRFGQWAYINSDEALYRGWRLGRQLSGQGNPAPTPGGRHEGCRSRLRPGRDRYHRAVCPAHAGLCRSPGGAG